MPRRAAALSLALATVVTLAAAPGALAHARLVESAPADGSALEGAPQRIELRFNEQVSPRFRVARLLDARGHAVAGTRLRATSDGRDLVVDLPRLRRGSYELAWEVLAEGDGHLTGGAVVFGVGVRPVVHGRAGPAPGTTVAALSAWPRWLDLLLLCALVGAFTVAELLAGLEGPRGHGARPRTALLRVAAGTAAGAALLGVVLLARQLHGLRATVAPKAGVADLLGARWGMLWLIREALLVDLAVLALAGLRRPRSRLLIAFVAAGLAGLAVVHALGSHAAADRQAGAAVAIDAAHITAAALWVGGVGAFALALATERGNRVGLAAALAAPFSRVAGAALGIVVVTGLIATGSEVASIDALLTTDYGRTLLIKAGLVMLAAALGLANALLLRRGVLPRFIRVETAIGASVLLAAAVLASSPPAKGPEFAAPRAVVVPTLARQAGDLLVTTTIRPNRPGPNVVTVLTASSLRPPPAPVRTAGIRMRAAGGGLVLRTRLANVGQGRFTGGVVLPAQGAWRSTVSVARRGRELRLPLSWNVEPPDPARPVVHSARRLAPLVDRAALALVGVLGAALAARAFARRLRQRRRPRTIKVARMPAP